VGDEVGNLTWILHSVWRHYRYSIDEDLMRGVLYPLLRRSVNYYLHIMEEGDDGLLHLPPTVSPEYGSFLRLTVRDCHYDLALLRWGCQTLLVLSERMQKEDALRERWQEVLERLVPLPADDTGYMVGRDTPLAFGHRHFSHLLAIFPLHLIGCDREEDRELIARSLRHWMGSEGDLRGFSFTAAASIAAVLGHGNEALGYLQTLLLMIKSNTMYREAGPVIETPLAGAESIHDMLLQSWGDTIRVFPAVPDAWSEASFHDLRAEGAFLISAVRVGGVTQWIRVKSLAGESCKIRTGWSGSVQMAVLGASTGDGGIGTPGSIVEPDTDGSISLNLLAGDEVVLYQGAVLPELIIRPVAHGGPVRYYGGHKPWRLYGV
jgi:hypothetical protein